MIWIPFALLFAFLLVLLAGPTIRLLEANPSIMAFVVLAIFVYESLTPFQPLLSLGPISVYAMDMVAPILMVLAFPFYYQRLKFGFTQADLPVLLFLLWSVLLSYNFLLGVFDFGIQKATNEFRGYLYFIAVGVYFASLPAERIWPRVERLWLWASIPLILLALIGYADGDLSRVGRPLGAYATFFLFQGLLIGIVLHKREDLPALFYPVCACLFPLLIILQHRTVWVVMLFSFASMFWLFPAVRSALLKWGTVGSLCFGTLAVVAFGEQIFDAVEDSYREAVATTDRDSQSTLTWRIEGWTGLLFGPQTESLYQLAVGNSFGTGWERVNTTSGVEVQTEVSPHNFYIQALLRSGLVGLAALIGLYYVLLRQLRTRRLRRDAVAATLLLLLFSQLLFFVAYGGNFFFAMIIGIAIAYIREPALEEEGEYA
jgi:hypothetical protein